MKKLLALFVTICFCSIIFAGGIVTNSNQSASWVRMPAQDASTGIPAAYYNPAGLMKLNNGFHISVSNQSIFQTREVTNNYSGPGGAFGLNEPTFIGKVTAPVFPSVYAVYKMEKIAFSFGFNPIGGGGGATFDKGLPAFEMSPSDLVPALAAQGASAYRLDAYFKGTSIYFGYQAGISYKINDAISIYGGVRYVTAKNAYIGHLKDIEIDMGGTWLRADGIMKGIAGSATNAATSTTELVGAGAGPLTLAEAEGFGYITTPQRLALEGGLASFGFPTTVPIATADAMFKGAASQYNATAALLRDQSADVEQTGSGISPILGLNLTLGEKINIGIKYEFMTKMDLTNKTTMDFTTAYLANGDSITMFPDGEKTPNDMPSMLSVGVSAKATDQMTLNLGLHLYSDKSANYGKKINGEFVKNEEVIDKNFYELAAGIEYMLSDKILVSAGYLFAATGVKESYQSDLSYSLTSSTFGAGGAYNITDKIQLNLGAGYSWYTNSTKSFDHLFSPTSTNIPTKETYFKSNFFAAIGVDFSF